MLKAGWITGEWMFLEDFFCAVAALVPARRNGNSVVALCYRRLSDSYDATPLDRFTISPKLFEHHPSILLESGFDVIGADRFWQVTRPAVRITFDDNLVSHVCPVLPVSADFVVNGTFLLNRADIDQAGLVTSGDVDAPLSAVMCVGGAQRLYQGGLVEFTR